MEQSGFQFGRRVEDQLDLLRALVAQGKVEAETARVCFEELAERARASRQRDLPRRRWSDHDGRGIGRLGPGLPAAGQGSGFPAVGQGSGFPAVGQGSFASAGDIGGPEAVGPPGGIARPESLLHPESLLRPSARARPPGRSGIDRRLDPERRRRLLQHVSATSLPVRFAGVLDSRHGVGDVPMVVVDCGRRPDVADLARVFRTEGIPAEARSRWLFVLDENGRGSALLLVGVSRPVRCRFRLLFSMVDDRQLLGLVGRAGGFVMTCADPAVDHEQALFEAMYVAVPSEVLALFGDDPSGAA
jgi:hypothetical protein